MNHPDIPSTTHIVNTLWRIDNLSLRTGQVWHDDNLLRLTVNGHNPRVIWQYDNDKDHHAVTMHAMKSETARGLITSQQHPGDHQPQELTIRSNWARSHSTPRWSTFFHSHKLFVVTLCCGAKLTTTRSEKTLLPFQKAKGSFVKWYLDVVERLSDENSSTATSNFTIE